MIHERVNSKQMEDGFLVGQLASILTDHRLDPQIVLDNAVVVDLFDCNLPFIEHRILL